MKWAKGYLAGLLTALLVCGLVVTAGAKSGKVMQELTYRDIRVSLDGEVLDLRNAIGDPVEPFMFDGTNYLPVRALAEALGLNVAWNGAEVMVVLTTPDKEETPEAVNATPEPEATQAENPPAESAPVTEPAPEPAADKRSGNVGKNYVEIKRARIAKDNDDGSTAIVITFAWTNNSDKTTSAFLSFMESAFQNGIELDKDYPDGYDLDGYRREIRPGATLEVERAFALTSETAPIEVEIKPFLGSDSGMVTATFNPAELKSD